MKILWLFKYKSNWNFNHWFHMDFAYKLAEYSNIELKSYGKDMTLGYPKLDLQPYNKKTTIDSLKEKFDFDIIIIDGKSRVTNSRGRIDILPKDFNKFNKTPKIVIEGDYHNYKTDFKWYSNNGIDIILHRHSNNVKKGEIDLPNIKHVWFPCSVDIDIFKPDSNIIRKDEIGFIGGQNVCYVHRNNVIKILNKNKLIDISKHRYSDERYIKYLQSYVSHINCGSVFNIETAKMYEIMACGSVLLTNESDKDGLKDLFYKDSYCTYKEDYSDLLDKVKRIIRNKNYRKYITTRAIKCISERHTHEIRVKQLLKIIKENYGIL